MRYLPVISLRKMQPLHLVWFKRDLRTLDHKSLEIVAKSSNPVLFIYLFEPSVMDYPDYDIRHLRFIHESLIDIERKFRSYSLKLYLLKCEANEFFEEISKKLEDLDLLRFVSNKDEITHAIENMEAISDPLKQEIDLWLDESRGA